MILANPLCAARIALGAALMLAAPLHAATVVASRGPSAASYPVGKKVPAGTQVALKQGDMVTLLDERGTRVLTGPTSAIVAQDSNDTRKPIYMALVQDRTSVRVRTGSVRSGPNGEPPRAPNLWYVDTGRPGTYCIANPEALRVWRAEQGKAATLTVKGPSATGQIKFGEKDLVAPWDTANVPILAGRSYAFTGADERPLGAFTFAVVKAPPADDMEAMADLLIAHGCTQQLDLLSTTLRLPES